MRPDKNGAPPILTGNLAPCALAPLHPKRHLRTNQIGLKSPADSTSVDAPRGLIGHLTGRRENIAMNRHSSFGRALLSVAACLTALAALPATASAQDFLSFLWGGGSREEVSISQSVAPRQIIVSFGDRKLYWIHSKGAATSYPIAVPREQSRWSGMTSVSSKRVNPGWTPTAEMRRENPKLPAYMPGGHPQNPLGPRALYLGASMYRIHGTDAPWTIGTAVSKGCIRMYNEDVLDLYPRIPVGTRVTVTWKKYTS